MNVSEIGPDGQAQAVLTRVSNDFAAEAESLGYAQEPLAQWGDDTLRLEVYEETAAHPQITMDFIVVSTIGSHKSAYACKTEDRLNAFLGRRLPVIREHLEARKLLEGSSL